MPRNSPRAPNGPARLPLSGGANLHRVYPIRPTTAERRMVDVETAARAYGCDDRAMRCAPLCDAPHSTRFAVFALRVAAAIAIVFVLLVGALAVTP